jgi:hypothetical protein
MTEAYRPKLIEQHTSLTQSLKDLVQVASMRVREGDRDSINRQSIALQNTEAHKIFHLRDLYTKKTPNGIISTENLTSGLFVNEINLQEDGEPASYGLNINIPRDTNSVNAQTVKWILELKPEQLNQLTRDILFSQKIDQRKFSQAAQKLFDKMTNSKYFILPHW